ncbi:MAG: ABC transporter permease [Pseudanabaenaceae cyanobacterium SKYGB_i_bin29]|nr:ABC transporter permease [Pseudanabaenaceae cyanobacterium SKYG29]MDW8420700.1 ABC transporter permease [Pseudanabaenaceae cyanobacterium SKYGB_i_bin29]
MLSYILQDSLTIWWGDWLDLRVRLPQVIASGLISPMIYIIAFGFGLGNTIDIKVTGGNYLFFILPGMVALSSMTISFGGTTFSVCGDRLYSKTFEELLIAPVHPLSLYLGKMLAGVTRGGITAISLAIVGLLVSGNWYFLHPLFLFVVFANSMVFSGLGVIVGLKVRSLEAVGLYNNFLIVPMSFLGATFFEPTQLPLVLKPIVYLLPLTHASIGLRAVLAGSIPPWNTFVVLLGLSVFLGWLGAYQFSHQQE